jgi:acyl-CoA dehydrogenase
VRRLPGRVLARLEPDRYPEKFVDALTRDGWLAALIPEEFGGAGLGLTAASVILRRSMQAAGTPAPATRRCTPWGTILRHGSAEQKQRYLPRIASGELRLQAFGVTEPTAGSDTTSIQTVAERSNGALRDSAARRSGRHARSTPT